MKIICVIPAYNEEKNIQGVIRNVLPFVNELVVVDDGSIDNTGKLANQEKATVLKHTVNRGQGAALRTGTQYAIRQDADIIVHFDADGQFLPSDINTTVAPILKGEADIVFGSRFMTNNNDLEKEKRMPILKKVFIMPLARMVNNLFFKVALTDPQSGFRVFSKKAAERINWHQDGMAHCSEILFASHQTGLPIKEVPITVIYNSFGQKFSGGLKILKDLFISKLIN
ncbi:MAG: Glycosyl transferase, family 2 [Parcubacteria group bacterium GW2011_GWE2_39_37]|uniref:Glycosyl transferase, family 2 n=1 Tax=Candidatus Falkowbacteria bacterium GW2011_GWF2_39_8 TaxID=1618642 RepID=A0A0G0PSZ5_9BACT|nr:MAG: Glycosyl transferase, family 2 [Parcubacteria group bacterium GW2011_GWE2_39_37]KKR31289.1 MAG: Glycosyl transferase, family 2 [Candidatus Falkowbacteria bacterium GW2011_GWF2_39_8]